MSSTSSLPTPPPTPTPTCSHWWHLPVYLAAAIALFAAAFSTPSPPPTVLALRRAGFHHAATLPPFPAPSTLLAVPDPFPSNLTLLPLYLPFRALLSKPNRSRLLHLILTKSHGPDPILRFNGVRITHPDLFLDGSHAIHGLEAPVSVRSDSPSWERVIRVLGSRGFTSFAVGLTAVVGSLPERNGSVTVFAPRGEGFSRHVAESKPLLEKAVGRHLAVGVFMYEDLKGMRVGERIRVLGGDEEIRVTASEGRGDVEVNGVEVTEPDLVVEDGFVVHGVRVALPEVRLINA